MIRTTILAAMLLLISVPCALVAQTPAAPRFTDCTQDIISRLANTNSCWVDLNNDGWVDLCAADLWINREGQSFEKLQGGVGSVVAADFDNDGFVDLFSYSNMRLLRNEQGESFTEFALPELPDTVSRGAAWGDFNNDGFVDLYIGGYENWENQVSYPDLVLINHNGQSFELAWQNASHRARGVTVCDFDQDGDPDVYVSNYRLQPNQLWVNAGDWAVAGARGDAKIPFTDQAADAGAVATSGGFGGGHSIGAAWGDFDNDGLIDLFAGNFAHVDSRGDQPKSRFLQQVNLDGKLTFSDKGPCGVYYQESYASPAAADFDNDGDLDLYFTTVYATASFGRKNFPVLFRNDGDFSFVDVTESAGVAELPATYQAAWADFDNDGDLDLVSGGKLFRNETVSRTPVANDLNQSTPSPSQHWLRVKLVGDGKNINRSAIGAQVRVKLNDSVLTRQVEAGTGEGNQNELTLHFGLGDHSEAVNLEILWPGGRRQTLNNVVLGQLHSIAYDGDQAR